MNIQNTTEDLNASLNNMQQITENQDLIESQNGILANIENQSNNQNKGYIKKMNYTNHEIYEKNDNSKNSELTLKSFLNEGSSHAMFATKNIQNFLVDTVGFYNPLRLVSTIVKTNSTIVKIPLVSDITNGWGGEAAVAVNGDGETNINLLSHYAKTKYGVNFTNTVYNYSDYVLNEISAIIAGMEREAFVNGKQVNNQGTITGILQSNIPQINQELNMESLKRLIFELSPEYRNGACFMMSSSVLQEIMNLTDGEERPLCNNANELFGYKVHTMDEFQQSIIFGNFKLGYVIADIENIEAHINRDYDRPDMICLSLPVYSGAAVIRENAFRRLNTAQPTDQISSAQPEQ